MSSKSNFSALSILLIVALLALSGFLWFKNSQLNKALTENERSYTELEKIQGELEQDYESALASLEEKRGENQELNTLIDEQTAELKKQKDKINGLIWVSKELDKAKEEINLMNGRVSGYLTEINKLKEENQLLNTANLKLSNENEILNEDVKSKSAAVERLDSVRVVLVSQTEDLSEENATLGGKVDIAEAVKINSITVEGFSYKSSGDLKSEKKGKNAELLRTCLLTETNIITPKGDNEFFVRIITPQGETLFLESAGGGSLENKLDGSEVRYTTSGSVDYNQEGMDFCIDWKPNFELSGGNYMVEIYNKGYKVGEGDFSMK